ncbi:hypothetical protein LTR53_017222 [Teratosphaeriaceae sp. CCFEE 6253]|nr:hypothetical protein LTR53_017222 [Teratosphaeriaceae sp. CCFEE 6253]
MASTAPSSTATSSSTSQAQAEARAAVQASLESAGSHYDTKYQQRAADLHSNAAAISKQETELRKNTAALAKESAQWQKEVDKTTKGLNEFGDLQNWAEVMEGGFRGAGGDTAAGRGEGGGGEREWGQSVALICVRRLSICVIRVCGVSGG